MLYAFLLACLSTVIVLRTPPWERESPILIGQKALSEMRESFICCPLDSWLGFQVVVRKGPFVYVWVLLDLMTPLMELTEAHPISVMKALNQGVYSQLHSWVSLKDNNDETWFSDHLQCCGGCWTWLVKTCLKGLKPGPMCVSCMWPWPRGLAWAVVRSSHSLLLQFVWQEWEDSYTTKEETDPCLCLFLHFILMTFKMTDPGVLALIRMVMC